MNEHQFIPELGEREVTLREKKTPHAIILFFLSTKLEISFS